MNIYAPEATSDQDLAIDEDQSDALSDILSIKIDDKNFVILKRSDSATE